MPRRLYPTGRPCPAAQNKLVQAMHPELQEARRIRSTPRWRAFSARFLRSHPFCVDPLKDHGPFELATETHHIVGLAVDPSLAFEESNLRGLCGECHRKVEARVRQGEDMTKIVTQCNSIPSASERLKIETPRKSGQDQKTHPQRNGAQGEGCSQSLA